MSNLEHARELVVAKRPIEGSSGPLGGFVRASWRSLGASLALPWRFLGVSLALRLAFRVALRLALRLALRGGLAGIMGVVYHAPNKGF